MTWLATRFWAIVRLSVVLHVRGIEKYSIEDPRKRAVRRFVAFLGLTLGKTYVLGFAF